MNINELRNGQGWEEISELEKRLESIVEELAQIAPAYASAKQIREFCSDRRKGVLADAIEVVISNKPDSSATAAEHSARALPSYKEAMKRLVNDSLKAESAIATWDVLQARLDCARSILSVRREMARI
jgi:hypothetical protein